MTDLHTYWASIGRNIGTDPMSDHEWTIARHDLQGAAQLWGTAVLSTIEGSSSYKGRDEGAYAVLFTIEPRFLDALRDGLQRLAVRHQQESVGLVGGPGETLVYAHGDDAPEPVVHASKSWTLRWCWC